MCMKGPLSLNGFLRRRPPGGVRHTRWNCISVRHFSKSGPKGVPLGACGAKWRTQQNKHLVPLNTSDDVLIKIVEKVRGHFMHTGRGSGPTLKLIFEVISELHF